MTLIRPGMKFAVDDQHLIHPTADAIRFTGSLILAWKAVFVDPLERRIAIGDYFWLPTTHITAPAPYAYGASWLPLADATITSPCSVTAGTLPTT